MLNTYALSSPSVFTTLTGIDIDVFKAFESPTLPVAIPQPFDTEVDQDTAYLSGIVPSDGAFQFNITLFPLILTERFVGEFIGG